MFFILAFFFSSVLIFSLVHMAQGLPDHYIWSSDLPRGGRLIEHIGQEQGWDQPLPVQYLMWIGRLLHGDLGFSYVTNRPVWEIIAPRIVPTVELVLLAEIVAVAIAIVLGVVAAVKKHSMIGSLASHLALVGYSAPNFWIALIVMAISIRWLPWLLPLEPYIHPPDLDASRLVLPTIVLAFGWASYLSRMVRSSVGEVLNQDYINTARAKGLRETAVIYKHALSNALPPVVKYLGYSVGFMIGGAVVIEWIFAWPGLGSLLVTLAYHRDYSALLGLSMIIVIIVLFVNFCADIAHVVLDPRMRRD